MSCLSHAISDDDEQLSWKITTGELLKNKININYAYELIVIGCRSAAQPLPRKVLWKPHRWKNKILNN